MIKIDRAYLIAAVVVFCSSPLFALTEAKVEIEANKLEKQIIAPCCWTNTIDEHKSPETAQLKKQIRFLLKQGSSPSDIRRLMVDKYGEKILATPPPRGFNALVWVGPPIALILASLFAANFLRKSMKKQKPVREANLQECDITDQERSFVEQEIQERKEV